MNTSGKIYLSLGLPDAASVGYGGRQTGTSAYRFNDTAVSLRQHFKNLISYIVNLKSLLDKSPNPTP
ncbi:MAG TPA: hypothetical protein ENK85_05040 [Saprospiraceae bacterium]|nr:hypothetical protein [Saprospiraceae bacterium]